MKKILIMLAMFPISYSVMANEPLDNKKYCYYADQKSVPGTVIINKQSGVKDSQRIVQVCSQLNGELVWLTVDEKNSVPVDR